VEIRYETNALNQYAAIDERGSSNPKSEIENPQFDPDGNLLEDTRNTYTWNADNNLIRVDAKDGSLRLDYIYDHQSRRTVRIETKHPGTKNEAQRTTYYLYDAWNVVADVSAVTGHRSGVTGKEADSVRYYTWGRDLSGSLQGAGGVGGLLAISTVHPPEATENWNLKTENFKTLYPNYDANGNIGQLINADANVVAAYAYDPFGNVTEMAGAEAAENPWRFSTKPIEAGTGWLYYGYRWYDAENGRWVNRDPIEESGGVNLYGFVGNDGVGMVDVLGNAKYEPRSSGGSSSFGKFYSERNWIGVAITASHFARFLPQSNNTELNLSVRAVISGKGGLRHTFIGEESAAKLDIDFTCDSEGYPHAHSDRDIDSNDITTYAEVEVSINTSNKTAHVSVYFFTKYEWSSLFSVGIGYVGANPSSGRVFSDSWADMSIICECVPNDET